MKRNFTTSLALLAVLLGCTLTGAAAASTPRVSGTSIAERAFRIDMATNRALLRVSGAAVSQAEKRERKLMTACLTRNLVQINEANEAKTDPNASKALQLVSEEAGVQYAMAAFKPVMQPLLNGVNRLLSLQLAHTIRATMKGALAALAKAQSLNVCADAQAWFADGLKSGQEPRATKQLAATLADFRALSSNNIQLGLGALPPAQLQELKLSKTLANKHINQLIAQANLSLETWIAKVAVSVAAQSTTTSTTTTTTTPSTTGTTTTGTTTTGTTTT